MVPPFIIALKFKEKIIKKKTNFLSFLSDFDQIYIIMHDIIHQTIFLFKEKA